jgi:hypothetical protein
MRKSKWQKKHYRRNNERRGMKDIQEFLNLVPHHKDEKEAQLRWDVKC